MTEYTKRRRELGKSKEELQKAIGVNKWAFDRIIRGFGNVFEDACIRDHLKLPERTEKRIMLTRQRQ